MRTLPLRRVFSLLAVALIAGTGAVLGSYVARTSAAIAGQGDFAGLVDIGGGRRMYLECRGQGGPTVILVSGYGNHAGAWDVQEAGAPQPQVLPAVARFTRVCAYDRPGT